jgi:hypothetical protein
VLAATIQRLNHNPIARAEWAYQQRRLERRKRSRRIFLYALYVPALLVASIPFAVFIDPATVFLLEIILLVIVPVYLLAILRTVLLAVESINRERHSGAWDVLVLSNVNARQIILSKWWAVVRAVYPEYLLIGLLRFALAYGLAQYLHSITMGDCHLSGAFCYYSHNTHYSNPAYPFYPILRPEFSQALLAFVAICFFSVVESAMVAAVGFLWSIATNKISSFQAGGAMFSRLLIIFLVLLLNMSAHKFTEDMYATYWWVTSNDTICEPKPPLSFYLCIAIGRTQLRIIENTQVIATVLSDGGVLFGANLMRQPPHNLISSTEFYYYIHISDQHFMFFLEGNPLPAIRDAGIIVISTGLYALLTYLALRMAQWFAIRHGALPARKAA